MTNVPTDESLTEPTLYRNSRLRKRPQAQPAETQPAALRKTRPRTVAMLRRNAKNAYGSGT
jgi:hypothetical protein